MISVDSHLRSHPVLPHCSGDQSAVPVLARLPETDKLWFAETDAQDNPQGERKATSRKKTLLKGSFAPQHRPAKPELPSITAAEQADEVALIMSSYSSEIGAVLLQMPPCPSHTRTETSWNI